MQASDKDILGDILEGLSERDLFYYLRIFFFVHRGVVGIIDESGIVRLEEPMDLA